MDEYDVPTYELHKNQDIMEDEYHAHNNLDDQHQSSDHNSLHPIEMVVLKPEVLVGGGIDKQIHEEIVEVVVKKEEMKGDNDTLMQIESISSNTSDRFNSDLYISEHCKEGNVEGLVKEESDAECTPDPLVLDDSFNKAIATVDFKSENESTSLRTPHIFQQGSASSSDRSVDDALRNSVLSQDSDEDCNKLDLLIASAQKNVIGKAIVMEITHCTLCGETFRNARELNLHYRIHLEKIQYGCRFCDYKTINKSNLTTHLRKHTGEKPYSCQFCVFKSRSKSNLNTHLRKHTGEKPYSCQFCVFKASSKSYLNTHIRKHTGEKPYSCQFCDFKTSRKSYLTTHLRKHTGEKPYSCQFCVFKASSKSNLNSHIKKHTGEKPYSCQFCVFKASSKSNLTTHLRKHTGERPYSCEFCVFKALRKSHLIKHLRIHTG